jgi:hypothetical protein
MAYAWTALVCWGGRRIRLEGQVLHFEGQVVAAKAGVAESDVGELVRKKAAPGLGFGSVLAGPESNVAAECEGACAEAVREACCLLITMNADSAQGHAEAMVEWVALAESQRFARTHALRGRSFLRGPAAVTVRARSAASAWRLAAAHESLR